MTKHTRRLGPAEVAPSTARLPPLTRDQVLAAALTIIDEDGADRLTMRRLGKALNRNPMAIYRHAADRDALLDGVAERVVAEVVSHQCLADGDVDWENALRRHAHAFRLVALAHPHMVPMLVIRPLSSPLALQPAGLLRPLEDLLEVFIAAGFDQHGAWYAARLFTGFLYGRMLYELQERVDNPDEADDLLRLGLHRLPITKFPRLRSLANILATNDGAAELAGSTGRHTATAQAPARTAADRVRRVCDGIERLPDALTGPTAREIAS